MREPDVEAEITLFSPAEGGRSSPVTSGYRPQHNVLPGYLTSGSHEYLGCDEVFPGQTVHGTITFITPEAYPHGLWVGKVLTIQEGNRVVGEAKITRVLNRSLEKVG